MCGTDVQVSDAAGAAACALRQVEQREPEMLLYCLPREETVATARGNHAVHVDACHIWGGVRDRWPREGRGMGFTCRQR